MDTKEIDCLFIGHNETDFSDLEKTIKSMGVNSGAYRDLNLNFIQIRGQLYSISDIYNMFFKLDDNYQRFGLLRHDESLHTAIAYLGTYLHRRGFTFDYINSFQNEKDRLIEILQSYDIKSIAILTQLYVSVFPILEIISFIKQYNSQTKIIVGGPFISTQIRNEDSDTIDYLFKSMDADIYVYSAQGEATLVNILENFKKNTSIGNVPNIYYKCGNNYVHTSIEVENNQLSENMVDWQLFKNDMRFFVDTRSAISCPFSCAFCGFPEHAGKYQTIDVDLIEKELNTLADFGTIKSVSFIDDTFNVPLKRFQSILKMIIRNKYDFKWNSHFRCQFADDETIAMMKDSGCEAVFLGIESANDTILNNMNKRAKIKDYERGITLLHKYNILTHASFIIGFPGETQDTVQDTIHFIEQYKPTFFKAQQWYCEKITPVWRKKDQYGIKGSNFEWEHRTMNASTASDIVENIFLSIKNSISLPSYNFEMLGLLKMLHRGMDLDHCKMFVSAFNQAVKEKLIDPNAINVSNEALKRIENAYYGKTENYFTKEPVPEKKLEAEFDF